MDATPLMEKKHVDKVHLTAAMKKKNDEMEELLLSVEKYAPYVFIGIVLFVFDMRFFCMAKRGSVTGMQDRADSSVFTFEYMWQEFLYKMQSDILAFLIGTMCMNPQTIVSGMCYTTAFTSPLPDSYQVLLLVLSSVSHAILRWNGYVYFDVLFAVCFGMLYNYNRWTFAKVFVSGFLLLIMCHDFLEEAHNTVRYIFLFFFVNRVLEFIPIVLQWWRVGICCSQLVLRTCRIILHYLCKMSDAAVVFLLFGGKCMDWVKSMRQVETDDMQSTAVVFEYISDDEHVEHVKQEYISDDEDPVVVTPPITPKGVRTRRMYTNGRSPYRGV